MVAPEATSGETIGVEPPRELDLKKDEGLRVVWSDGAASFYPIAHLRRMSPSAEARELRSQMQRNPLTVLTGKGAAAGGGPLKIVDADLVGNYAIRFRFSDGHSTGIFSWDYLRSIDPGNTRATGEKDM
jgi:DUF971 family protein